MKIRNQVYSIQTQRFFPDQGWGHVGITVANFALIFHDLRFDWLEYCPFVLFVEDQEVERLSF